MTSESGLWELAERLGRALPALQELVDESRTRGAEPVSCTDATGTVHVALAADGLPDSIRVGEDWRRAVGAAGLAAAVTEACHRGEADRSERVAAALHGRRWPERAVGIFTYIAGNGAPPLTSPRGATPTWSAPAFAGTRSLLAAAEQIAAAHPSGDGPADPVPPQRPGAGAHGRLTLTLTGLGTITCDADPDWVAGQEARDLDDALASALTALRSDLDAANPERPRGHR